MTEKSRSALYSGAFMIVGGAGAKFMGLGPFALLVAIVVGYRVWFEWYVARAKARAR